MRYALLLFGILMAVSCSSKQNSSELNLEAKKKHNNIFLNTSWKVVSMNQKSYKNTKAYLEFKNDVSRFYGNDGCNLISGDLKLTSDSIGFSEITSTKMLCENMAFSNEFTRLLTVATSFNFNGDILVLFDKEKREILKFKK